MTLISIPGCCTVPAILLLRILPGRCFPRRIFVLLWAGALLILLAPTPLASPLSLYGLFSGSLPTAVPAEATVLFSDTAFGLWPLLCQAVTALGLLTLSSSWLLSLLRLRRARPCGEPAVRDWLAAHPLLRPLRICVGQVPSPVCSGLLLPRIILPADFERSDRSALDCVLSHEYVHICRFDPLLKLFFAVAVCLRWYDPFVWIAALTAGRDMEYACDEAVLDAGIPARRYAAVLLRAALRRSEGLPVTARFTAGRIERRVTRISSHRAGSPLTWLAAGALALSLLLCLGTVPKSAQAVQRSARVEFMVSDPVAVRGPDAWTWDPAFPSRGGTANASDPK